MAREITTVAVVGLGTMGAGIAEVMARNGLDVVAVEADPAAVEARARSRRGRRRPGPSAAASSPRTSARP